MDRNVGFTLRDICYILIEVQETFNMKIWYQKGVDTMRERWR